MIKWDGNGTWRDAYGELFFKRCVRFLDENGAAQYGGVHLAQSTETVLCVQLFDVFHNPDKPAVPGAAIGDELKIDFRLTDETVWVDLGNARDIKVFEPDYSNFLR